MKITKLLILIAVLALSFDAVLAADKPRSGLSYTAMGQSHKKESGQLRSIEVKTEEPEQVEDEEPPASKVWKKYKALAAGQHDDDEPATEETAKEPQAEEPRPQRQTGLAGIIEQYRQNKENGSSMKSINVSKPKAPDKPNKPQVKKPSN